MDDIIVTENRLEDLLIELSLYDTSQKDELNIVLLSDSEEFKKLNYFIFSDVENIKYHTMDTPFDSDLSILSIMDVIIFHKEDIKLEELILTNIIQKHLNSSFIYVTQQHTFRREDTLLQYLNGVSKIIKLENELEEYIFEVQKELKNFFYIKRLASLKPLEILYKKEDFEKRIDELISKKICFTKLRYHYDSDMDISEYNLKKILREQDTIYIDKQRQEMFFIMLNVLPNKADSIIKSRLKNFSIRVSEVSHKSVFDIVFS